MSGSGIAAAAACKQKLRVQAGPAGGTGRHSVGIQGLLCPLGGCIWGPDLSQQRQAHESRNRVPA